MKIIYKNFIIEEDVHSYILTDIGVRDKGENIWEEYIREQVYPSTLERAVEGILKRIKTNKQETIELRNFIEETKRINSEFLEELRVIINN